MEENIVIVYCTEADFQFLAESFEEFSQGLLEEFNLPEDSDVQIEIDEEAGEGTVDVFFNGESLGSILIQDEAPAKKKKSKETRVLH